MDYRKLQGGVHAPIYINGAAVERAAASSSLASASSEDASWSLNTGSIVKTERQLLLVLSRLKRFSIGSRILSNYYRFTIESVPPEGGENCIAHHQDWAASHAGTLHSEL